jgi:hypothetical protein
VRAYHDLMRRSGTEATLAAGDVFITRNAVQYLTAEDITTTLDRHLGSNSDQAGIATLDRANVRTAAQPCRKFYAYRSANGVRFWGISEADLSVAVLLPEDCSLCIPTGRRRWLLRIRGSPATWLSSSDVV